MSGKFSSFELFQFGYDIEMTDYSMYRFGTPQLVTWVLRSCCFATLTRYVGSFQEFWTKPVASVDPNCSMVIFYILGLLMNIR